MPNQLLLLEDVDNLGRSGDVVSAKPGYARNFLIPKKKAVPADKFTLRMQARLKAEREKQAEIDRSEAELFAQKILPMVLDIEVKVDQEGHLYGSVASVDIVRILEKEGIQLEKKNVILPHPIKTLGVHKIHLKLKEGVESSFSLNVISDKLGPMPAPKALEPEATESFPEQLEDE